MKKQTLKHLALLIAISSISALAQADVGKTTAYAEGVTAETVWKNSFGECWRTGTWTPAQAIEGCDGYVKPAPVVTKPAPVAIAPAPKPAPAPAPVVAAPAVAAVAVAPVIATPAAAAPAPKQLKFALKSDVLFDVGKSALKPKGKLALDAVHTEIQQANLKTKAITVFGYADRMGNATANQKLSEARANTVASYLRAKGQADETIRAEGRGISDPVTGNTCDKITGAKLSACLAPDRRVELEASGTPKQ